MNDYRALLIDDERNLRPGIFYGEPEVDVARTSAEAIQFLRTTPEYTLVLWDHDLGGEDTTREVIRWIEAQAEPPKIADNIVHSMNPIGAKWVHDSLKALGYKAHIYPAKALLT